MNPIDYRALAQMLMGQMARPVADDPMSRRDAVNHLMGLEGAGGPRAGGGTVRAYHGTKAPPFEWFDLNKASDPGERGVFFTPNYQAASRYAQIGEPSREECGLR